MIIDLWARLLRACKERRFECKDCDIEAGSVDDGERSASSRVVMRLR